MPFNNGTVKSNTVIVLILRFSNAIKSTENDKNTCNNINNNNNNNHRILIIIILIVTLIFIDKGDIEID